MSLFEIINQDIKKAMLNKEAKRLESLRAIKAAFLLAKTEKGNQELSDSKALAIIQKLAKQRLDSAVLYKENNRMDLYDEEMAQAKVIQEYLPKSLTEEELKTYLLELIKKVNATSVRDMGKVMSVASQELAGKADGKRISDMTKTLLG